MKKILGSIITIALVATAAIGATGAFFTDNDVSNNNVITSGTLEIQANDNTDTGTSVDPFLINLGTISGLVPGDMTGEATVKVKNVGTVNAATFGRFTLTDASTPSLAEKLNFYLYKVEYFNADDSLTARWAVDDPYYGVAQNQDWFIDQNDHLNLWSGVGGTTNLQNWVTGNGPLDVPGTAWDMEGLKPGEYYILHFKLQMDPAATDAYEGTTVSLGYEVKATQINTDAIVGLSLGGLLNDATYVGPNVVPYLTSQVTP